VNRSRVPDQVPEEGAAVGLGLRHVPDEERRRVRGGRKQALIAALPVSVAERESREGGRDRVRRAVRVEEDTRLYVEVVVPAGLVVVAAAQFEESMKQLAASPPCFLLRQPALAHVRGGGERQRDRAASARDPEERPQVRRRALYDLRKNALAEDASPK